MRPNALEGDDWETVIEFGYDSVLACDMAEGDFLKMNFAPDAEVLNVELGIYQVVVDIRHGNGDSSSLSYRPGEIVAIRRRIPAEQA